MKLLRWTLCAAALAGAVLASAPQTRAQHAGHDWPNWRGPHFNGSSDETGLPVKFSPTENVRWSADLPGPSASTPIIVGDRVFLSAADLKNEQLLALCLDRKSGAILWTRKAGSGYRPAEMGNAVALDYRSNYSSQSPVSDGKRAIFYYGNGDLVAFDFAGNEQWRRNIQKEYGDYSFGWTYSSSPLLFKNRLYIQVLQRDKAVGGRGKEGAEPFLLALEPATGKEIWKHVRPSPAKAESREAFTTPIPFTHNGRTELLLAGGDVVSGHDPDTGKEFWRWGTWNLDHRRGDYRLVPSPVGAAGTVLVCGPKREPVFGVKAGREGDISADGLAWKSEPGSPLTADVSTPLIYQNRLYLASDQRRAVTCADPATGKIDWSTPIPGVCWASATGADGKIYAMSLKGEVYVLDAKSGELLATNPMALPEEDELRSSPVVAHGALFIRTPSKLYCIANP